MSFSVNSRAYWQQLWANVPPTNVKPIDMPKVQEQARCERLNKFIKERYDLTEKEFNEAQDIASDVTKNAKVVVPPPGWGSSHSSELNAKIKLGNEALRLLSGKIEERSRNLIESCNEVIEETGEKSSVAEIQKELEVRTNFIARAARDIVICDVWSIGAYDLMAAIDIANDAIDNEQKVPGSGSSYVKDKASAIGSYYRGAITSYAYAAIHIFEHPLGDISYSASSIETNPFVMASNELPSLPT